MTVELHGGPHDGQVLDVTGNHDWLITVEFLSWRDDTITHKYDAHTGQYVGIDNANGIEVLQLRGGPMDGKTIQPQRDCSTIVIPEVAYLQSTPFICHQYRGRTGEYMGVRLDEPAARLSVELFPRWARFAAWVARVRRLRLRVVDRVDSAGEDW